MRLPGAHLIQGVAHEEFEARDVGAAQAVLIEQLEEESVGKLRAGKARGRRETARASPEATGDLRLVTDGNLVVGRIG